MFNAAVLILRLGIGLTFAGHGAQKAFGWWGGPGMAGWNGAMEHMGFRPARLFAIVSMLAELVGGILLAIGLLTPFAAAVLVAQSIVIIFHVHWPKGFWNMKGGIEFPLALATGALAIGLLGAGTISLDSVLKLAYADNVKLVLIALGIVGGAVSLVIPRSTVRQPAEVRG